MTQHKWHKEITHFINGGEVICAPKNQGWAEGGTVNNVSIFDNENYNFKIKPQFKEPQYLYVYEDDLFVEDGYENEGAFFSQYKLPEKLGHKYIGKIKLEVDDESTNSN